MPTEAQKAEIVARYTDEAREDDARYNPLQCAAYNGDKEAVQVLTDAYAQNGTLAQELRYSEGKFGENILHIAIKDPVIFEHCCAALKSVGLFEQMLMRPDGDGDTVMHQVVEFGRKESLAVLMSDDEVKPLLAEALQIPNKHGETALELAENFERSQTINTLKTDEVLTDAHLMVSRQNLPQINEAFSEIASMRSAPRM